MFEDIVNALKKDRPAANTASQFAFESVLNPEDLQIEIKGLGGLPFPISEAHIQALLKIADLAKFGFREQTLQDTKIRNTYEIAADQIQIKGHEKAMAQMLRQMRETFGLSEHNHLTAHLHNLLIYGPGQFFKFHQDSEKLDGMVATLVVVLPSPHIGGDLIIKHQHETHRFVSENLNNSALRCIAFYSDCQHEVETVKQGHRIALTFNVVLQAEKSVSNLAQFENVALKNALQEYFDVNAPVSSTPLMLSYFLDHHYSEHGLRWEMLKGADGQNAMAFRQAAKQLNLIPHLALVEIHELWNTDGDEEDPELYDLIDGGTTLSYWLDEEGQALPYENCSLSEDEVCWSTNTKDLEPDETEYEGWMGNYGNTVDYWYRRAAVVLWRAKDHTAMDFQLNYDIALNELMELTHAPGCEQEARRIIKNAGEYIQRSVYRVHDDLQAFMKLAAYIQHKELAQSILQPFYLMMLTVDCIKAFVLLQERYGVSWCLALMKKCVELENGYHLPAEKLIKDIDLIATQAKRVALDQQLIAFFINYQFKIMLEEDNSSKEYSSPLALRKDASARNNTSVTLLKAAFLLHDAPSIKKKWVTHMISDAELYSVFDLSDIYFSIQEHIPPNDDVTLELLKHISKSMGQELQAGLRDPDDWSIDVKLKCHCEYCKIATTFLRSSTESKKVWPIAQQYRDHVADRLGEFGLPVDLSVEKKGRPYQLVLEKTADLYRTAKRRFETLKDYSKRLEAI